jgi:hypothetical protein
MSSQAIRRLENLERTSSPPCATICSRGKYAPVVAPFSPGPHSQALGQPVRAYHFTAPRPARNLLPPRGMRGCPHRGPLGRSDDGASPAWSRHSLWLSDRSQRGTVCLRRPRGSIAGRSEQRFQHGETAEYLSRGLRAGPAASPLLYVGLRMRDATDLAWTASGRSALTVSFAPSEMLSRGWPRSISPSRLPLWGHGNLR